MEALLLYLSNPMVMKHRTGNGLARKAKAMEAPDDYYAGRKRWEGGLPDNMLVFSRTSEALLNPKTVASHLHHRWVLMVALEGKGTVYVDRRPFPLGRNKVLLIPPLRLHQHAGVQQKGLCWLFVTFDWPGRTGAAALDAGVRALGPRDAVHLEEVLMRWEEGRTGVGLRLAAAVAELVLGLYPELGHEGKRTSAAVPEDALLAAVRREFARERGGKLSVPVLARRLGFSESHLRAVFRQRAGLSLGRYLRETRLREAAILLRSEDVTVKEAAERLGFPDIYTFSRSFTRALGMPPSQIRQLGS